jgi:penicillin-binding protein 2
MNQEERKTAVRRMRVLVAAACILMLLYGLRLIFLQLVNGDDFKSQATNTTDYKFTVTAARGDIVDSRGERIATSVTGYNVVLNKLLMGEEDRRAAARQR